MRQPSTSHDARNMGEHDYYPIAAAINILAEVADEHDGASLITASRYLDMAPAIMLRGMAFLSECLEANKDAPALQARMARSAIREVTALCAVLMDIECMAATHQLIEEVDAPPIPQAAETLSKGKKND